MLTVCSRITEAALLSPLWALEIVALFTSETPMQGLVLALGATLYVLVGILIARGTSRFYSTPPYAAGYCMTIVAPLLTWTSQPFNVIALVVGSATYALPARTNFSDTYFRGEYHETIDLVARYSRVSPQPPGPEYRADTSAPSDRKRFRTPLPFNILPLFSNV